MLANDMRDGMEVTMKDGREGTIRDNKKGIIRLLEVKARNGFFNESGDTYIDEFDQVQDFDGNWSKVEINRDHNKKLTLVRNSGW